VRKTLYQANRLISAEPKESTVNLNSVAGGGKEFDHTTFDRLLGVYVDDDGWVDYASLKRERPRLDSYLASLATVEPRSFSSDRERLAFWINAYNGFTLADVLDSVYGIVKTVQAIDGFFDKQRHRVASESLTLDDIEQRCRGFGDPRVHFALVCASTSCPKLQRFAYTGSDLDKQLDRAAHDFLADPARGLHLDRERNEIFLSPIFKWYAGDFTMASSKTGRAVALAKAYMSGTEGLSYVREYSSPEVSTYIDEKKPGVRYLNYDWTLNAQEFRTAAPLRNKNTGAYKESTRLVNPGVQYGFPLLNVGAEKAYATQGAAS